MKTYYSSREYLGLGKVPIGIGAVLRGWDISEKDFRDLIRLPVVDLRVMTRQCPNNCFHCFTNNGMRALPLLGTKVVISQIAQMGARGINFLGEGEPTLDPNFLEIVRYTTSKGVIPVIFTEAAARMRNPLFVIRTMMTGASICPKCDSLFNPEYQNRVVGDKMGVYFKRRNQALKLMMRFGLNRVRRDGATRLGFDMVVTSRNIHEVPDMLRFCRKHNIWVIFSFFLPTSKSDRLEFGESLMPTEEQKAEMREAVSQIDEKEFGFPHPIWSNFATMPCVERMQIMGNGNVSPCPGNRTVIGNIANHSIWELHKMIIERFPKHDPTCFDGHCLYRPRIGG